MTDVLTVVFTAKATRQTQRALAWWRENRLAAPELLEQELRNVLALIAVAPRLERLRAMLESRACDAFF